VNSHIRREAIIYCRVSDDKQVKLGDGLNSQETRCREYAKARGYDVVAVFKDDIPGAKAVRPGFDEALAYLRKNRARRLILIIDHIDRLARRLLTHISLRIKISEAGGFLESPSMEFGDSADSQLVEHLLASVAQHHSQKNAEQTTNRMRARVMNGYWVFQAPVGYRYERVPGRGMMLKRDEPAASVVQEALEGYASGRFELQADVMRFLQDHPNFPRDGSGYVRNMRVTQILNQCAYAGFVAAPKWGVTMREGHHEGLVSIETFQRVQDRLNGINRAPNRTNLNTDFALRGWVVCDHCNTPLTACWSKGQFAKYPYYLCPKRGCPSYGKSIRREKIEGEFAALLNTLQQRRRCSKLLDGCSRSFGIIRPNNQKPSARPFLRNPKRSSARLANSSRASSKPRCRAWPLPMRRGSALFRFRAPL
jgi:DNA invertase Pin-like site-specific DNA recombinase